MNVKIIGDGSPRGTKVISETGEDISNRLTGVHFHHEAAGSPIATIGLSLVQINYEGAVKVTAPNGKVVKSIIYEDGSQEDF